MENDHEHHQTPVNPPMGIWLGAAHDVVCPEHGILATFHMFEMTANGLMANCSTQITDEVMKVTDEHMRTMHPADYLRLGSLTANPFMN